MWATSIVLARNAAAIAAAALLAACGDDPQLARLGSSDVVLAFGDSLTYGTGASQEESYPVVLSKLIGREVVGAGVPGEVTADGLERLPGVLDDVQPRLLLLCLGGNDMLRKLDSARTEANLRAMVKMAKDRNIGVVLIAVPTPGLFTGNAAFYGRIAEELELPIEDEIIGDLLHDNEFKSDPIHPNAKGYRKMAEAMAQLLRDSGAL